MTEYSSYDRGVPCWIDLTTSDPEGARNFFAGLFGWQFEIDPDPQTGHYTQAYVNGKRVAGLGGDPAPDGQPSAWTTYLASDDVDADAKLMVDAGAGLLMEPLTVGDAGRMLLAVDPTGGAVGLWQGGSHKGSELANVPGSFTWNELATRDAAKAREFYAAVFGYTYGDMSSEGFEYHVMEVKGRAVAGIMGMGADIPPEVPPHWLTYFAVDNTDSAVAKVRDLGGQVIHGPSDSPYGRVAGVTDPQGAAFSVMQLPEDQPPQ